ncbi:MAG: hypothetical protein IKB16_10925 [Lentisphaeria bacterium]|nr:hypothetical protein [Lentisphaeria bacterium]
MIMVLQSVKCKITVDIAIETIGNFIAENMYVGDAFPGYQEHFDIVKALEKKELPKLDRIDPFPLAELFQQGKQ